MLKVASLTERCVQTTLFHLAGGVSALQLASHNSMPLGALHCRHPIVRHHIALTCQPSPRSFSSVCPESLLTGSARETTLRASAASKEVAELRETSQVKPKIQNTPRRARQPSLKLTDIRGVGKKNEQLLLAAGYTDIPAVREYFLEQCRKNEELFRQHLQRDVGIKLNMHQEMIAKYIQESSEGLSEMGGRAMQHTSPSNYVTLSVEGNISAGKSTFLRGITDHCPDLQDLMHVAPEPVDRWQNVNASNGVSYNLLDQFYHDKKRYAYIFQNYIFFTRMMQEKDSGIAMKNHQPYRLLERSIFCDRMVFVESLKDSNFMSEMELTIYNSWFDPIVDMCKTLVPDGFIYLRAQPDTCMNRMMKRSRNEETGVGIDYLQDLHQRHEDWLCSELSIGDKKQYSAHAAQRGAVIETPGYQRFVDDQTALATQLMKETYQIPKLPDLITSDVKFLNKKNNHLLHSTIDTLPALVLDCEKDLLDIDAQREHARKVNCYFEYVKETRKQRAITKAVEKQVEESAPVGMQALEAALLQGGQLVPEEWRQEYDSNVNQVMRHVHSGNTVRSLELAFA